MTIRSTSQPRWQNEKRSRNFILDPKVVQGVKEKKHQSNIKLLQIFKNFVQSRLRVNGYYPGHDLEDCWQEAYYEIWKMVVEYDLEKNGFIEVKYIKNYLHFWFKEYCRRLNRAYYGKEVVAMEGLKNEDCLRQYANLQENLEKSFLEQERRERIRSLVRQLPQLQQDVLRQLYRHERPCLTAAEVLGVTDRRLRYARDKALAALKVIFMQNNIQSQYS